MTGTQATYSVRTRNPDVLSCIANLSNDEVFTPPEFASQMLDTLARGWADANDGADIWTDSAVTFLDPFTKSGVFLREITKRLVDGLASEIPDLQERVDHILTKQIFGIGITEITSLLARRSLYCSKDANGEHSVATSFVKPAGNIWYEPTGHTWVGGTEWVYSADKSGKQIKRYVNGKCKFCGAPQLLFDRDEGLEAHSSPFIHTENIKTWVSEIFEAEMHFDVVIGNPPYQMTGGAGGSSDSSIYHLFVEQAQALQPRFLAMVVPSRWLAGGRGMGDFRKKMLSSSQLIRLVDYPVSKEVFPGVEVKGGICYFLWSLSHNGPCEVSIIRGDERSSAIRRMDEFDVFVRDPRAVTILRKVQERGEVSIAEILTADTPFGIATNFTGYSESRKTGDVALHYVKAGKRGVGYLSRKEVRKNVHLIDNWKVLAPKAGSDGGQKIPDSVLGKPWLSPPPSVATQTFLAFVVASEDEAVSLETYYRTKFFRFLVSLRKITQDALRPMYQWVPEQMWDREWTDEALYEKYRLTKDERAYIELAVRPMEATQNV